MTCPSCAAEQLARRVAEHREEMAYKELEAANKNVEAWREKANDNFDKLMAANARINELAPSQGPGPGKY